MDIKFTTHPTDNDSKAVQTVHAPCKNEDQLYSEFISVSNRIRYNGYSEMCKFVENNIFNILSSAINRSPKSLIIITNKDFLSAMEILNINLDREYTNRFNRVYRAYVINPSKNQIYNQVNANMMYRIALKLNKEITKILMDIGLSEPDALWIAVNRYSSTDERRNIRRAVRVMQHFNPFVMTEEFIIKIFSKLFNDQLCNLFISIMTDRFDSFDSDHEKYIYSTISNSILYILNTMNDEDIQDILIEYTDELRKSGVKGRFYLRSINSEDYENICNAINELEEKGFIID